MPFESINPYTQELLRTYPEISDDAIEQKLALAEQAYQSWRHQSFATRQTALRRFADLLNEQESELSDLISLEMGKRTSECQSELRFCGDITRFYADNAEQFLADRPMPTEEADAYLSLKPLGPLLGIMPWNFPFYQVVRFATPNLMAGNTVLVKHASNVPQCAERIEQMFNQAGLPTGAYQNLFISVDQVGQVIDDSRIQGVSLTGSERAGSAVAERAGKQIKKSVLELGGNDPFIVLDDADLEATVDAAIKGRIRNAGQSCVASKRFIVVEPMAEAFITAFAEKMSQLRLGDPRDPDTQLGPLSTEAAAQRLDEQVQSAIQAGATVVIGGQRPDRPGAFYSPTILTGVTADMPTYNTELFGPVATVYIVADEAAAIALANDSQYGLGGSVYTRDLERGRRVAEQVETGMMFINEPTRSQTSLPFGGIKHSGYGRELSHLAIEEFVNRKLIHVPRAEGG